MTAPQQPQERRAIRYDELELRVDPEPIRRLRTCHKCSDLLEGPVERRRGLCADCDGRGGNPVAIVILLLALAATVAIVWLYVSLATPRSGSADLTRPALTGASPAEWSLDPGSALTPLADGASGLGGAPSPTTEIGTALEAGWATWCAETATKCKGWDTRWVGAVPSFTHGDEPYGVQVCLLEDPTTCTHVVVVSHCACGDRHGDPTVIDLSPPAFRELAPLRRGVIRVTVEGPIPVPDRPAMTLPATDEEDR